MIISNCPKEVIALAALQSGVAISYCDPLSSTGRRHRVKLTASSTKSLKVEAGEKTVYSHTVAQRDLAWEAYRLLIDPQTVPPDLLTQALRARHNHDEAALASALGISVPALHQAVKLAKIILGRQVPKRKRIAKYQRRSLSNHDRACGALCWHGFRDFFMALFQAKPDARVRTARALYKGFYGFLSNYPKTGDYNIGSNLHPLKFKDACWCQKVSCYTCGVIACTEEHPEFAPVAPAGIAASPQKGTQS